MLAHYNGHSQYSNLKQACAVMLTTNSLYYTITLELRQQLSPQEILLGNNGPFD